MITRQKISVGLVSTTVSPRGHRPEAVCRQDGLQQQGIVRHQKLAQGSFYFPRLSGQIVQGCRRMPQMGIQPNADFRPARS